MKKNKFRFSCFPASLLTLLFLSCSQQEEPGHRPVNISKEDLIEMNKGWTIDENMVIRNYIRRKKYDMQTSPTGIYYMIYQQADSARPTAQPGQLVTITYDIILIEGDSLAYTSGGEEESFRVAMDYIENGLHEAITYMREGEKAKIILPYSRAYGLVGDMDQIPPQAPLLYDIHLKKIKE